MTFQAPIKVNPVTKERIRLLAAFADTTQSEIVDRAVGEYLVRHPDVLAKGIDHAKTVLDSGSNAALAAYLLDERPDDVQRVAG